MIEMPYGQWPSPITAEMLCGVTKSNYNCDILVDGQNIYWTEVIPTEKGRTSVMQWTPEKGCIEFSPPEYDVRSKVHEYGGLAYAVEWDILYFIHSKDQRLYKKGRPLTQLGQRFADLKLCSKGILAIRESHETSSVINDLVLIDKETGAVASLDAGHDFYASPTLSSDGSKLAWLTWDHPDMPWDATQLWVADFKDAALSHKQLVAGGGEESIFQPQWSPEGILHYISDKTGWWNIYREDRNLYPLEAEFGLPLWRLGLSTWGFIGEQIFCAYQKNGVFKIGLLTEGVAKLSTDGHFREIPLDGTDYTQIQTGRGFAVFLMGSPTAPRRVVKLDLSTQKIAFLDKPESFSIPDDCLSIPEPVEFPTSEGKTAHAFFYPPANNSYKGPAGKKPPLIVLSHGGPTGSVNATFNLKTQYWTSRGFALLDVNYGGSTGYGRAYRERLKGKWGIVDVQDCANGALYLSKRGDIDPNRCFIRGGSAGGYTTLASLAFTSVFRAGASYYGVGDLELLAKDTHKFESRYLDSLIGPYPERRDLYQARSPLKHADRISCPVIFFQGGKDKVVPPNQAESMAKALQQKGIPTKLILYPDEEHGFRQAETIRDSLEKELQFYQEI